MSAAKDFTHDFKPKKASPADRINFFMGTNASGKHLEEAMRQGIIGPGERLLGFFDGIFFDSQNKRIGGLALHDYLIVTDRHVILWARDQFKDFVDRFDLAQSVVVQTVQKDGLHGTLALNFGQAEGDNLEPERIDVTFDFVPLPDLKQIAEIIEVAGNVHRDLEAGGAGEKDRWQATWVLFNRVFVSPQRNAVRGGISKFPRSADNQQPELTGEEEAAPDSLEELITPLSRLDNLDGAVSRRATHSPTPVSIPRSKLTAISNGDEAEGEATGQHNHEVEADLQWLSGHGPGQTARGFRGGESQPGPGTRLKQDLTPDGLYSIGRAGRAAWDGIDKVRREAESRFEAKGNGLLPMLNSLRESGMNLKDISEFVTAINNLLETVNNSPAAYELAMNFINRSSLLNNLGGGATKHRRAVPEVEDMVNETPAANKASERPKANSSDPFHTPRKKVSIRKRGAEDGLEEVAPQVEKPEILPGVAAETLADPVESARPESSGSPLFNKRPVTIGVRTVQVHSSASEINNN